MRGTVQALTDLVGSEARVAVSANALDMEAEALRQEWLGNEMRALSSAGLAPVEVDLRDFYADSAALVELLARRDMVWATGGNVFVLRKALKQSRLDQLLLAHVRDDSLAYGGCSAGACVCGPTLRGIDLVDTRTLMESRSSTAWGWSTTRSHRTSDATAHSARRWLDL